MRINFNGRGCELRFGIYDGGASQLLARDLVTGVVDEITTPLEFDPRDRSTCKSEVCYIHGDYIDQAEENKLVTRVKVVPFGLIPIWECELSGEALVARSNQIRQMSQR